MLALLQASRSGKLSVTDILGPSGCRLQGALLQLNGFTSHSVRSLMCSSGRQGGRGGVRGLCWPQDDGVEQSALVHP